MKKEFLFVIFIFLSLSISAQKTKQNIIEFENKTNAKITIDPNFGIPNFIKFPLSKALHIDGNTLHEKVIHFLKNNKSIFKIKSVTNFTFENEKIDSYGMSSLTIKQNYNDIPVYDGELRFHFNKEKNLTSINGSYIPSININTTINLNVKQANAIAIQKIKEQNINFSNKPIKANQNKLYVFHKGLVQNYLGTNYLVYEIEVTNEVDVREFIFIDARNGKVVEQFTGIAHIDRIIYENNTSNIVWQEGDALPGSLSVWQKNEVIVSGHVYNFFKNAFNYISYDNADAQMRTVNNDPGISCPNANWNGYSANYCDGTASDDVIAHEWGHAYTQHTSGLIYAYQSGAMNESFSDIWGETIDLINAYEDNDEDLSLRSGCSSSHRWLLGEDATSLGVIRDMWNPTCLGDPGRVGDSSSYWCNLGDSGGVHTNSGIPNHVYALLVDGGFYNGQNINGVGFIKAAHIFWRAQTEYLTATSDFNNLADALEASCADLLGFNLQGLSTGTSAGLSGEVLTSGDLLDLQNVIFAVELRQDPSFCNFTTILSSIDPLCESSNSPIFFEDWETGIGNWTVEQLPEDVSTWEPRDWVITSELPKSKGGHAIFGVDPINGDCTSNFQNGIIRLQSPIIDIPNFTDGIVEMAFLHNISTETNWDGGNIKYKINNGSWELLPESAFTSNPYNGLLTNGSDNPLQGEQVFTGSDEGSVSSAWGTSVIDLSSINVLPNSTVQFRWEMSTDGCNGSIGWYVDDIRIYNCEGTLDVSQIDFANNVNVYPNPSSGIYTIKTANNLNLLRIDIYDITGRLIKSISLLPDNNKHKIDLSDNISGMYFFKIIARDTNTTLKIIKN